MNIGPSIPPRPVLTWRGKLRLRPAHRAGRADDAPSKDVLADLPPELSPELSLVLAARHGQENVVEALVV